MKRLSKMNKYGYILIAILISLTYSCGSSKGAANDDGFDSGDATSSTYNHWDNRYEYKAPEGSGGDNSFYGSYDSNNSGGSFGAGSFGTGNSDGGGDDWYNRRLTEENAKQRKYEVEMDKQDQVRNQEMIQQAMQYGKFMQQRDKNGDRVSKRYMKSQRFGRTTRH